MEEGRRLLDTRELEALGIGRGERAYVDLSPAELVEHAIRRGEAQLTSDGALTATTGQYTGRSPKDKFVVQRAGSPYEIFWGKINQPISPEHYQGLKRKVMTYLAEHEHFVFNGFAGADPKYRMPLRVVSEYAWHSLFVHQLFLRPTLEELRSHVPEFTILSAPSIHADPAEDGTNSETFVVLDFEEGVILIGGTEYAGEMKKSIFTVLNTRLPYQDVLPMHCSANIGEQGDVALFFGLSGTGKTTLSADPSRRLIGDDEHGWTDRGVFNFEGGCYAKCINLSQAAEPQIWDAIRFGAVLENVVVEEGTRAPDYASQKYTENTRAAYPVEFIPNAVIPGVGGQPTTILFLTADATGVLPPISRLDEAQAMYHFLAGYTSKLAGTERGVTEPSPTFSTCFGEPFWTLAPTVYARMLGERIARHNVQVFLVNTGWTGGPYGEGKRMNLAYTRTMVQAAIAGKLRDVSYEEHPVFGIAMPTSCPGVPSEVLNPRNTWQDKARYDVQAKALAEKFQENAKRFNLDPEVAAAGPKISG